MKDDDDENDDTLRLLTDPPDNSPYNSDYPVQPKTNSPPRVLSLISLIGITFFCVAGGGYGSEVAVSSAPPLYVLLGFLIVPWLWGFPMSLITAELSCAIPEDGGCVLWAKRAFGDFVAFQVGYYSWVSSMVDLCLYPKMFTQYLFNMTGNTNPSFVYTYLTEIGVVWLMAALNIFGVELVGIVSDIFCVIVLSPFVILIIVAFIKGRVDPKVWVETKWPNNDTNYQWGLLLSRIVWCTSGFDSVGQLAGEVKDPPRSYPKGMIVTMILTLVSYVFPLLIGMSVDQNFSSWKDGHYSTVSKMLGGRWLSLIMSIGGTVSALGLFNCLSCNAARNLFAMAENGFVPKVLENLHPTRHTPYLSIIVDGIIISVLLILPFDQLLVLYVVLYTFTILIDYIVWAKLKWYPDPTMQRPYKIPGGSFAYLWIVTPIGICVFNFVICDLKTKIYGLGAVGLGLVFYLIRYLLLKYVIKKKNQLHGFEPYAVMINDIS